jgi:hypothetical protein
MERREPGHQERRDRGRHHQPEVVHVAEPLLQVAGHQAGDHHAQPHQAGAEGIVGGGVLARCQLLHQVDHEAHRAEAVEEFFDRHAGADHHQVGRLVHRHQQERHVRDVDGAAQQEQRGLQAALGDEQAAQQRTDQHRHQSIRAVYNAQLLVRQPQAALGHRIDHEERADLFQQADREAEQEREADHQPHVALLEERGERILQDEQCLADRGRRVFRLGPIGHHAQVPQRHHQRDAGHDEEHDAPAVDPCFAERVGIVAEHMGVQPARQVHQAARCHDRADVPRQALDAAVQRLRARVQRRHVDTVGGDILRGADERQHDEQADHDRHVAGQRHGQRHAARRTSWCGTFPRTARTAA